MNRVTFKLSDIMKLVKNKIESSFDETLKIDEIDIVDDKNNKKIGRICLQEEFKDEEITNLIRLAWRRGFLALGILLLFIFLFSITPLLLGFLDKIKCYVTELSWCSGWAAIGIYLGLYNSRFASDKRSKENRHYRTYFLFVFVIATRASFVVLGTFDKNIDRLYVYAAALLTGVIVGFSGDKLGEKLNLIK